VSSSAVAVAPGVAEITYCGPSGYKQTTSVSVSGVSEAIPAISRVGAHGQAASGSPLWSPSRLLLTTPRGESVYSTKKVGKIQKPRQLLLPFDLLDAQSNAFEFGSAARPNPFVQQNVRVSCGFGSTSTTSSSDGDGSDSVFASLFDVDAVQPETSSALTDGSAGGCLLTQKPLDVENMLRLGSIPS